jgi:hypothetical protein
MSEQNSNPPPGAQPPGQPDKGPGAFSQEARFSPVSARVPERIVRGVMATGVLVLDGPNEFLLDFVQALTRPYQIAARIVLSPAVMEQFVLAVRDNLRKYEQRFGPPPVLPRPPTDRRPTLQEIYDELKIPDELLSGTYANAVMVGHSPSECFFDFITNFFPTSAVSARVFMAVAQLPRTLEALTVAYQRYQQRIAGRAGPPQPPRPPEEPGPPSGEML